MSYFLNLLISLTFILCCVTTIAQVNPVYNSFYLNPYFYNPAEAVTENTTVYALYRQQWLNIEGAPTLTALTFTSLLNQSRTGLGANFNSYSRGIIKTSDAKVTYAHAMPLSKKNWLFFGLSGGLISNAIDLEKVTNEDLADPVLAGYLENNMQPAANAGLLYRSGSGFNFGFALPQLFAPKFNSAASFSETKPSPFDNVFLTLYYKRKIASHLASKRHGNIRKKIMTEEKTAPLEFYLNYRYSKFGNNQLEALLRLSLSEYFWVGASYRFPYGYTGNIGINAKRFTLGYSYEPGSQPENGFSLGTHELILGLRLGEKKQFKRLAPNLRSLNTTTSEKHVARFNETNEDPDKVEQPKEDKKRYYVVIRAFLDFNQADNLRKKLVAEKFNANIFYNKKDKKYYVHVLETDKAADAHEEVKNLKAFTKLKEAHVITLFGHD